MNAGGRTLLEWHFERLGKSGCQAILATTDRAEDDPLNEWACESGIAAFRGSEDNVLSRYRECARRYKLDVIVRVTSDCPLIDGELVASGIQRYLDFGERRQYLTNGRHRTFPRGFDFEIFSSELLEEAFQNAVEPYEFEHVTPYFYRSGLNRSVSHASRHTGPMDIALRHFEQSEDHSHLRVTVDTIKDYELVRCLIEDFNAGQKSHRQITEILNCNPHLVAINHDVEQKQVG